MSKSVVNLQDKRVLVIENNKMMRRLVREMLLNFRIKLDNIVETDTVENALQLVYHRHFDIVITDFFLGDLDAGDIVHHIRHDQTCINRKVPILLITASPNHEKVLKVMEAGINEVLAKPIAPSALYYRLVAMLSRPRPFVITSDYVGPSRSLQRLESVQRLSRTANARREWRTVYRSSLTFAESDKRTIATDNLLL